MKTTVLWKTLHEEASPPKNAYGNDAGWDLRVLHTTFVPLGKGVDVRTGVAIALPDGFFARIVGRSSALRKKGLLVIEGIIDPGFRGELFSYVFNPGVEEQQQIHVDGPGIWLTAGESVAQVIIQPIVRPEWVCVDELPESARGTSGFGSSGS
jgi:dUTP pyrophosphatase